MSSQSLLLRWGVRSTTRRSQGKVHNRKGISGIGTNAVAPSLLCTWARLAYRWESGTGVGGGCGCSQFTLPLMAFTHRAGKGKAESWLGEPGLVRSGCRGSRGAGQEAFLESLGTWLFKMKAAILNEELTLACSYWLI